MPLQVWTRWTERKWIAATTVAAPLAFILQRCASIKMLYLIRVVSVINARPGERCSCCKLLSGPSLASVLYLSSSSCTRHLTDGRVVGRIHTISLIVTKVGIPMPPRSRCLAVYKLPWVGTRGTLLSVSEKDGHAHIRVSNRSP
jgi:hypothetical protein